MKIPKEPKPIILDRPRYPVRSKYYRIVEIDSIYNVQVRSRVYTRKPWRYLPMFEWRSLDMDYGTLEEAIAGIDDLLEESPMYSFRIHGYYELIR